MKLCCLGWLACFWRGVGPPRTDAPAHRAALLQTMHRQYAPACCPASAGPSPSGARAEVFVATFRRLVKRDVLPSVLHPAVRVPSQTDLERVAGAWRERFEPELAAFLEGGPVFLSINRFERKKARRWPRPRGAAWWRVCRERRRQVLHRSGWQIAVGGEPVKQRARAAAGRHGGRLCAAKRGPGQSPAGAGCRERGARARGGAPRPPVARARRSWAWRCSRWACC